MAAKARFAVKYKFIYKCETYKFLYFNKKAVPLGHDMLPK